MLSFSGSSLVPFLFNIYVNELGNLNFHSSIFQAADDTVLLLASDKLEKAIQKFQNGIKDLMKWFGNNYIFVNREKTNLTCIRKPHKKLQLTHAMLLHDHKCLNCSCPSLKFVSHTNYLGLHLDSKLSCENHLNYVVKKTKSGFCLYLQNRKCNQPKVEKGSSQCLR